MERKFVRIGYVFSGIDFRLALLQHFAVFAQTFCMCWCVGSRPAGSQCVNKRFIHCEIIARYVTSLQKCAATQHLRSVELITSLLVSKTWNLWLVPPECVGDDMVGRMGVFFYITVHFLATKCSGYHTVRIVFNRQISMSARLLRSWVRIPPGAWIFVVSVVCCQVEVSATSWSLVQRSPTDCGASLCVI